MAKKRNPVLDRSFSEVFKNPPKIVKQTERKKGKAAARKQKVAIAMSKARRSGY